MVGSVSYYRSRHDDFVKRHPDLTPPPYYLAYGEKYAHAFTDGTLKRLSPEGRAWLQRTFEGLQGAIEERRRADPAAFDKLEQDPTAFKGFAYDTHPAAYLAGGLAELPASDLVEIATTPDLSDLVDGNGLIQVYATAKGLGAEWAESVQRDVERLWSR